MISGADVASFELITVPSSRPVVPAELLKAQRLPLSRTEAGVAYTSEATHRLGQHALLCYNITDKGFLPRKVPIHFA